MLEAYSLRGSKRNVLDRLCMEALKLFCGATQLLILPGNLDSADIPHRLLELRHGDNFPLSGLLHVEENDYERTRDIPNETPTAKAASLVSQATRHYRCIFML